MLLSPDFAQRAKPSDVPLGKSKASSDFIRRVEILFSFRELQSGQSVFNSFKSSLDALQISHDSPFGNLGFLFCLSLFNPPSIAPARRAEASPDRHYSEFGVRGFQIKTEWRSVGTWPVWRQRSFSSVRFLDEYELCRSTGLRFNCSKKERSKAVVLA